MFPARRKYMTDFMREALAYLSGVVEKKRHE